MEEQPFIVKYQCGHECQADPELFSNREELYRAAESFPCPDCCRNSTLELQFDPVIYVNMQKLSHEMSALVLEVTQCCPSLENLLTLTGYTRRGRSLDELTPGGKPKNERHAVWRKEFWFAASTNPFHVIALTDLVKDEARWLATYLPAEDPVRYLDFPD